MYDTFLTGEFSRGMCRASLRRFFGVFPPFPCLSCISLIFCAIRDVSVSEGDFRRSKIVQNACKIVYFAASGSLFCGFTLTILPPHFDYFGGAELPKRGEKGMLTAGKLCFGALDTCFSCWRGGARKCQWRRRVMHNV